mmetsp:Transcript_15345/g.42493  ORF Transcript_15345/g.42493 Transcript_15345/m.42493 type:complete len:137 (-) Transcript_15345:352-762(-)
MYSNYFDGFEMFGIIKETGVDDQGLAEFHSKYFTHPIFRDQSYAFYQALGDRKVSLSYLLNPAPLFTLACEAWQRVRSKEITGNVTRGEGLVQGGIIIFDAKGKPVAMYEEQTGSDLPVADLISALEKTKNDAGTN